MQKRRLNKDVPRDGEASRYMENAREILKDVRIEDDYYQDKKPVREAFGTVILPS
ncbi:MAG: DUF5618 family protein [Candidatus Magnetobacterium sp. LHC-1]